MWLKNIYKNCIENLQNTDDNIAYRKWWRYIEYTEWYSFRNNLFKEKIKEIIEKPYFEKVFYIVYSAILSSNNEKQFLHLLDRYLSAFFAKKLLKKWEDFDEKKTIFAAELDFISDDYLKNKFLIEKWDWKKFENSDLKSENNIYIYSFVEYIYEEVEKKILKNIF